MATNVRALLGEEAEFLLSHRCEGITRDQLVRGGVEVVDRVFAESDRPVQVLRNLRALFAHGRLGGTGYLSILPVDQGIEHSAAASFVANPRLFDPAGICELALEGGCNGVASTLAALGIVSRKYAHRIPFIAKLNHNELLSYPNTYDQVFFGSVEHAWELGAAGVGATVYFGSPESRRQLQEVSHAFELAHRKGMFTVLWCYLRNPAFHVAGTNYEDAADLTAQANHLGVTLHADIIKQKLPTKNGGFPAVGFGKTDERLYGEYVANHPIDWARLQVLSCFAGRVGLINSGGASRGAGDLEAAVRTAVINKRAGGIGLISGRKAFQRPLQDGVKLLHAIQDVYLDESIDLA